MSADKRIKNPWMTNFTYFWVTDDDLFHYTQEDFERKAQALQEDGVDVAITFAPTHFRWSFRPYWDRIHDALKKLTDACHKYGIQVVEHHSCRLSFNLHTEKDWEYIERFIGRKGSSIASWEGWREYLTTDPLVDGRPISSFYQVDGRTGKWIESIYHARSMCFNNPHYLKAYFAYLEQVYATGIDGIMTDDVQFENHACTCEHCRRLFKEETGYELPDPEHWEEFYDNYKDPVYVAWKRFRLATNERFQRKVNQHFESLGLKMLRPNYISDILRTNWSAYPFENCAELWDYIFQENLNSAVIGSNHLAFMSEALHRYAMARPYGVPSMSHFYPDTPSELYLSWALAQAWGQIYLGTAIGSSQASLEKRYREFERSYEPYYTDPCKHADLAFYLSKNTRDYAGGEVLMDRMIARIQGAFLCGVQLDMVFAETSLEVFKTFPCIALCDAVMISEEELEKLCDYLYAGGRLLIEGTCGTLCADGSVRDYDVIKYLAEAGDVQVIPEQPVFTQQGTFLHRYENIVPFRPASPNCTEELEKIAETTILPFLKGRRLSIQTGADIRGSFFTTEKGYAVHLYNSSGLIPEEGTHLTRNWQYPNYEQDASPITESAKLTICRCDDRAITSVKAASPEWEGEKNLVFKDDGQQITVEVPENTFAGYLLIMLD